MYWFASQFSHAQEHLWAGKVEEYEKSVKLLFEKYGSPLLPHKKKKHALVNHNYDKFEVNFEIEIITNL